MKQKSWCPPYKHWKPKRSQMPKHHSCDCCHTHTPSHNSCHHEYYEPRQHECNHSCQCQRKPKCKKIIKTVKKTYVTKVCYKPKVTKRCYKKVTYKHC
ncbi:hypothetical protein PATA110616_18515 [Paenibacillus tarimensis]